MGPLQGPGAVRTGEPRVNGRCSGHRAPCFCMQLSCDMMLAHGGSRRPRDPKSSRASGLTVSVNCISAPAAPGRDIQVFSQTPSLGSLYRVCAFIEAISAAAAAAKSLQSCPSLCNPRDGSPPGCPIPGILQARTLEWLAISFSKGYF